MFKEIPIEELSWSPFPRKKGNWFLVTAGNESESDTLLATLGGLAALWGGNTISIFIRKSRYTREFLDREDHFSVSVLPKSFREAVHYCGTHSGREGNKLEAAGLTEIFPSHIPAVGEAGTILLCRKLASVSSDQFTMAPDIHKACYEGRWEGNPHIMYIGEIEKVLKKE